MAKVVYRGVPYDTDRKAPILYCETVTETYRGVKHVEVVCREKQEGK